MLDLDAITPEEALVELHRQQSLRRARQKAYNEKRSPEAKKRALERTRASQARIRSVYKWVCSQPDLLSQFEAQEKCTTPAA